MHEHVADRAAGHRIPVHQLGDRQLPAGLGLAQRRRLAGQPADAAQQVVGERKPRHLAARLLAGRRIGGEVPGAEVREVLAGDDDHPGQRVERFGLMLGEPPPGGVLSQVRERRGLILRPVGSINAEHPAAEQPPVSGPHRPHHDQHAQPGGQQAPVMSRKITRSPRAPCRIGAAEQPAFLPALAGEALQPVQHGIRRFPPPAPLRGDRISQQAISKPQELRAGGVLAPGRHHSHGAHRRRPGQAGGITRAERGAAEAPVPCGHQSCPNTSARSAGS